MNSSKSFVSFANVNTPISANPSQVPSFFLRNLNGYVWHPLIMSVFDATSYGFSTQCCHLNSMTFLSVIEMVL